MDETEPDDVVTVGQRLREAREAKGLSVEDIAAQTRIPTRHLISLETGDWDKLPAATYSVGFAKNYAGAVGLDRNEIGEQLRIEMGGTRNSAAHPEIFEAADPARTMPKGLVFAALGLLVLVVLGFTWLSNRSLEPDEAEARINSVAPVPDNAVASAPQSAPSAAGPVVLTATDTVWIEVKDGAATLHQGELAAGQSYTVPANATAPMLTTGKPEALRITVGTAQAPPIGEPGTTVSGVSLKPGNLLRPAQMTPIAPAPPQAAPATPRQAPATTRPRPRPAPPPAETPDPGVPNEVNSVTPGTTGQGTTQ
ncbi:MAG TPA: RodZ domain-containing protein [Sphingomicrobium sp.]|nr:RodZ domain-containing protein [Sphingomicrobium sp.]